MDEDTIKGVVEAQVENPRPASTQQTDVYMPPKLVEGDDLNDVSSYVASVAGVPGIKAPVFAPPQFFATNCGGCHTLAQAGTTGTTGPNLDDALKNMSAQQISQSISDPNAVDHSRLPAERDAAELRPDPHPTAAPAAGRLPPAGDRRRRRGRRQGEK